MLRFGCTLGLPSADMVGLLFSATLLEGFVRSKPLLSNLIPTTLTVVWMNS